MRIASIIVIVPVPLSVAPCEPSHESKCAESRTYSFGFSVPLIDAERVVHRHRRPSDCGVGVHAQLRTLVPLGEPIEQAVVLAAHRDAERGLVLRVVDRVRAPRFAERVGEVRHDHAERARLLDAHAEIARRVARRDRIAGVANARVPVVHELARSSYPCAPSTPASPSPPTPLPDGTSDTRREISTNLPFAFGSHFTNSLLSVTIGRTIVVPVTFLPPVPGLSPSDRRLERAHARLDEVDVASSRDSSRATCRTARGCASMPHERYIFMTQSLASMPLRRSGEARADRVEERLREIPRVRAVHAERPHAGEHRIGRDSALRLARTTAARRGRRRSATDVSSRERHRDSPDERNVYGMSFRYDVEDERRIGRNRRLGERAERERGRNDDHPLPAGVHADHAVLQTADDLAEILLHLDLLIHDQTPVLRNVT